MRTPAFAPVPVAHLLHQCGYSNTDIDDPATPATVRTLAAHVIAQTLPALRRAHLPPPFRTDDDALSARPDLCRALTLLCAADFLRRTLALPGVAEAVTVAGVQFGKSALPLVADRFEADAWRLLRHDAVYAAPTSATVGSGSPQIPAAPSPLSDF